MFVTAEMLLLPFVLAACGHAPTVGTATVATATVMVQVPLILFLDATVMVFAPAVAVTVPPVHVPPVTLGVATRRPTGKVSVKLTAMGDVLITEKVSVAVPPTVTLH